MKQKIYHETLPKKAAKLVKKLQGEKPDFLNRFYLSGGTALSLQLGHRESLDLDFFSRESFDPNLLQAELEKLGKLKDLQIDKDTLNAFLHGVRIQFLGYPYLLLEETINWDGIKLSSTIDIACTKLHTISTRGNKKDFIDLYFLLNKYTLKELFNKLKEKYKDSEFNQVHILKSLVYFQDANSQPMPKIYKEVKWQEAKKSISDKVRSFALNSFHQ